MSPPDWVEVERIYHSALTCDPDRRMAFVAEACSGDEALQREVQMLLAANDEAGNFLETGAITAELRCAFACETASLEGQTFGNYRVLSQIGSGGMGRVYLAEDTSLDRKVALKVLAPSSLADSGRHSRLVREAKAASALNHPNILTVYQIGEMEAGPFIATEFVEGETLRERLTRDRLQIAEAVSIARQAAAALGAAHAAGIVHRDVKPENIMIRPDGLVKILDFGLARSAPGSRPRTDLSNANQAVTFEGAVAGTPQYMSPEQARGEAVDARTDIFSLGTVIYEMLAGQLPFGAKRGHEAIQAILHEQPQPLAKIVPGAAGAMEELVHRALAKDRAARWQSMAELSAALDTLEVPPAGVRRRYWWAAAAIAGVVAAIAFLTPTGVRLFRKPLPAAVTVPLTAFPGNLDFAAFSPDGSRIAFSWDGNKPERKSSRNIYIKPVGAGEPVALTHSQWDERLPAWSPDGRFVAFERDPKPGDNELWVVSVADGTERKIADCGVGLDWSPDGKEIAFVTPLPPAGSGGISAYSLETGRIREITSGKPHPEGLVRYSPDGKQIAFQRSLTLTARELFVVPREGGTARRLTFDNIPLEGFDWTADGRELVFASRRQVGFNLWRIAASGGTPERIATNAHHPIMPVLSRRGNRLAFTERFNDSNIWQYTQTGAEVGGCLICSTFEDVSPLYSPDGKRVAFMSARSGAEEIWVADRDGSHQTQLTRFNGPPTVSPRWSPDGHWIAFDSSAEGSPDIFVIPADGGTPRRLTTEPSTDYSPSWSHDGRWLYFASDRTGATQIWKTPFEGGPARQVTFHGGSETVESPDGRRMLYTRGFLERGIYETPVDGGPEELLPGLAGVPQSRSLAVDQHGLYFVRSDEGQRPWVWLFDFEKRTAHRLFAPGRPVVMSNTALSVSPDGSLLVATLDHRVDDLMMIENFR